MILFVRNGQTRDIVKSRLSGGGRNIGLNTVGIEHAYFAAEKLRNEKIDICFFSPQKRAKKTAKIILKYHKNTPRFVDERLRERRYGELEGKDKVANDYFRLWDTNYKKNVKGMETVPEIVERVFDFYNFVAKKYPNKTVLVVSHNGIARCTRAYFEGIPQDGDLYRLRIDNAQVLEFDYKKQ